MLVGLLALSAVAFASPGGSSGADHSKSTSNNGKGNGVQPAPGNSGSAPANSGGSGASSSAPGHNKAPGGHKATGKANGHSGGGNSSSHGKAKGHSKSHGGGNSSSHGKGKGQAKHSTGNGNEGSKSHGKSSGEHGNPSEPAGKTTICHATGSSKNPYVEITPSNHGVQNGHAGHQDGRDIIPAPAGGCPGGSSKAKGSNGNENGGKGNDNGHGKDHGKTTICHATGSATNPYVEITPSNSGVEHGHAGHQDGRDIIPAPAGGCPGAASAPASPSMATPTSGASVVAGAVLGAESNGKDHGKTTICHATGSATNPYVEITPSNEGVEHGHAGHQDGRDIIPAPAGGCPGAASAPAGETPTMSTPPSGAPAVAGAVVGAAAPGTAKIRSTSGVKGENASGSPQPANGVLGQNASGGGTKGRSGVRGVSASNTLPASAVRHVSAARRAAFGRKLPFTGFDLLVTALLGLALLGLGLAGRRASRTNS